MARIRVCAAALLSCAVTCAALSTPARAQEVEIIYAAESGKEPPRLFETLVLGAAGALSGFLLHESGHVLANLILGNTPHVHGMWVHDVVPFFVISPDLHCRGDRCVKRDGEPLRSGIHGEFLIVTAGFTVQHLTDEILLSLDPNLRERYAPFTQGLLAFNVLLTVMYAVSAYTGLEDPHGDMTGAARCLRVGDAWVATALLLPAALDAYRYFVPSARWAAWTSRAAKAGLFGVSFVF
jgi:hypothetical protein